MDDRILVQHSDSSASDSSRASSSMSTSSDIQHSTLARPSDTHAQLPLYHALRATTINCENPGYDTDAESNPKLTDRDAGNSDKSISNASDKSILHSETSSSGESMPDQSDTSYSRDSPVENEIHNRGSLQRSTASSQTADLEKTSQKSEESLTTVSSISGPSSNHQSTKTLSTTSTTSG